MNLWNQIQLTKVHYQAGFLTRPTYIAILNLYYSKAVRLQEGK